MLAALQTLRERFPFPRITVSRSPHAAHLIRRSLMAMASFVLLR